MDDEELARMMLPAVPGSVRDARELVARALDGRVDTEIHDAAVIVVSELSANAMLHAETDFEVVVRVQDAGIRLEVHDGNLHLPRRKRYSEEATTGRGLVLVEALATVAGAERTDDGKVVWAVFSDRPPAPPVVGADTDEAGVAPSPVDADLGGHGAVVDDALQVAACDDGWDLQARLWADELCVATAP